MFDIEVPPKNSAESKKKNNPSQNNAIENDVKMPTDSEILLSIFSTRKKSSEIEAIKILDQIKSGKLDEKAFSNAQSAAKVLCANENGVVLIFNDEIDAKLFNNFAKKKDFILACCKLFRNPKFVVGFTAAQINNQKTQMLEAKKHPKPALNLDALRNILNKDASIEQIAFNTIYKFIKDKD
ncbi:MAG: hypothetical protein MJ223_01955 [Mycoplasmoidaceae bacterium]|nr:hypothetical protein [Mycoplasmoidaceae bacterium]